MRRICASIAVGWLVVGLVVGTSACGVPTGDDSFRDIPENEIQFGLDEVSTTTSSTTTSTTAPNSPATSAVETTTTVALALDQVQIYFLSRGRLQPVTYGLPQDYNPNQVIELLEAGPDSGPAGVGLESLIEQGLIVSAEVAGGVVTIDLDPDIFDRIASFDQSEAIGQIVTTMTDNLPRVGLVLFTLGGEPTEVKKGNSLLSGTGVAVSFDDYRDLLASSPTPTTTQPETTQPQPPQAETTTTVAG